MLKIIFLSSGGLINEGEISTRLGLKGIPSLAEKIIVERDLSFIEEYQCKYHISQISSKKTLPSIKKAKEEGKIFLNRCIYKQFVFKRKWYWWF